MVLEGRLRKLMDVKLLKYGWDGSANCSILNNAVIFESAGYIVNNNTFHKNTKKVSVKADFTYSGVDIGVVLWYNKTIGHLKFGLNTVFIPEQNVRLGNIYMEKVINDVPTVIRQSNFDSIPVPIVGEKIELTVELYKTNIKCFYNGIEVFNIDQGLFSEGVFGLYGEANETCSNFEIQSEEPSEWQYFLADGCSIINTEKGQYINIANTNDPFVYMSQSINSMAAGSHTISFDYIGAPMLEIYNDTTLLHRHSFPLKNELTRTSFTFQIATPITANIKIGSNVQGTHCISRIQIEQKPFDTFFTEKTRGESSLTFPVKDMNTRDGGLCFYFSSMHDISDGIIPLFYYSDNFHLYYTNQLFVFTYGNVQATLAVPIFEGDSFHISAIWNNEDKIFLSANNATNNIVEVLFKTTESIIPSEVIYVGCDDQGAGNILLDNFTIFTGSKYFEGITGLYPDNPIDNSRLLKADFEKETLVYDDNKIFLPASKAGSPIIVEDSDGQYYERVTFIKDNSYSLFNTETFLYDGDLTCELLYDNLLNISVYSNDEIFEEFSVDGNKVILSKNDFVDSLDKIVESTALLDSESMTPIVDELGQQIYSYSVSFKTNRFNWSNSVSHCFYLEDPDGKKYHLDESWYSIDNDNDRITLISSVVEQNGISLEDIALNSEFKAYDDFRRNEIIRIEYTVKYTYIINYFEESDQYYIQLSNTDGKDMVFTFQEKDGLDKKLLKIVETNPFKTGNNNGFIYIEKEARELETFNVKVTPDSLVADGFDTATITIDCLSKNGIPTSNVDLEVLTLNGYCNNTNNHIPRYVSPEEIEWMKYFKEYGEEKTLQRYGQLITDEHRSGRFIYKYRANKYTYASGDNYEIIDNIVIRDTKSKIGIQIPIRLVREQ